jgi:hypothetical protein
MKKRFLFRSAVTGRFVSRAYALANPSTTVCEVVFASGRRQHMTTFAAVERFNLA